MFIVVVVGPQLALIPASTTLQMGTSNPWQREEPQQREEYKLGGWAHPHGWCLEQGLQYLYGHYKWIFISKYLINLI